MTPPKVPFSFQASPALARHRLVLAAVAVVASLWALPRLTPAFAAAATGGASLHVLAVADTGSGGPADGTGEPAPAGGPGAAGG
jgi:hypothetical protein